MVLPVALEEPLTLLAGRVDIGTHGRHRHRHAGRLSKGNAMRRVAWVWVLVTAITVFAPQAKAEMATVEVMVAYRERIALPPDAQLEVELLDVTRADARAIRLASQRFAMTGVPMTVTLAYDPQLVGARGRFALGVVIWSGQRRLFALTPPRMLPEGPGAGPVDVMLAMVPASDEETGPAWPIAGITWRVTEVLGEAWSAEQAATLTIDEAMRFSLFAGCNRYVGQLELAGTDIAFPPDFAGTLMACPDAVEVRERQLVAALKRVAHLVRYGAGLVLTDAAGNALLHFAPVPD